ncbi:MAG: hypothetical protein LUG18_09655 [Candidatus Azobacteroides sp.]|nr:hypothetical protein [Candidatus Azobacteroides sp.]
MNEKPSVKTESLPLAYVKSTLENLLVRVSNAGNDRTFHNYHWYDTLFPERVGERVLAVNAIKYPELHGLM